MLWTKKTADKGAATVGNPLHKPILNFITAHCNEDFMNAYHALIEGSAVLKKWREDAREVERTLKAHGIDNATNFILQLHDRAALIPPIKAQPSEPIASQSVEERFSGAIDQWLAGAQLPADTITPKQRQSLRAYFRFNNTANALFVEIIRLNAGLIAGNEAVEARMGQLAECMETLFPSAEQSFAEHRLSAFHDELIHINAAEMADELFHGYARDWMRDNTAQISRLHSDAKLAEDDLERDSPQLGAYVEELVCHCLKACTPAQTRTPKTVEPKALSDARAALSDMIGKPKIHAIEGMVHKLVNSLPVYAGQGQPAFSK
jgi:hypothetical protein